MLVDAHLHLWSQDHKIYPWSPIGGYTPENDASEERFRKFMRSSGVDGAVLVQPTPYGWDNSYLLDAFDDNTDSIRKVVLVEPTSPNAGNDLQELIKNGAHGLRINLHIQPIEDWNTDAFFEFWKTIDELGIPVCFQLTPDYFPLVKQLASEHPNNKLILDHMARPTIGSQPGDEVFQELLHLADHQNIFVKLSGLNYFSSREAPYEDTWPLLISAKDCFGAERCIWGSDFPFVEDHWGYQACIDTYRREMGFTTKELDWIMGGTARAIWW